MHSPAARLAVYAPVVAIISLLLLQYGAFAQLPDFRFETISVEQGLSQSSVFSIYQDSQGFLWFGTGDGLNRYDGYGFKVFHHDPADPRSLGNDFVDAIAEDSSYNLWFATRDGLYRYERSSGIFSSGSQISGSFKPVAGQYITSLLIDHQGLFWFGTPKQVGVFHPATGEVDTLPELRRLIGPRVGPKVLFEDDERNIWFGMQDSFCVYRRATHSFEFLPNPTGAVIGYGLSGFQDGEGTIWLGVQNGSLLSFNRKDQRWRYHVHEASDSNGVGSNYARAMKEDDAGRIWIATTREGLIVFEKASGRFHRFIPSPRGQSNSRYEGAVALCRDRSGLIWVGYDGSGIVKINPHQDKFHHILFPLAGGFGTGDNFFKSIMLSRSGEIWAGTYDKGIKVLNRSTGDLKAYTHRLNDQHSLRSNTILALYEDRRGVLWIGTIDGVDAFERESGHFRHLITPYSNLKDITSTAVNSICEDEYGTLWAGSARGLMKFDSSRSHLSFFPLVLGGGQRVQAIIERIVPAGGGGLWIATNGQGLLRFQKESAPVIQYLPEPTNVNSISTNVVKSICTAPDGILWLGTGEGLNRFDPSSGAWKRYHEYDGLPNDFIYGILMENPHELWISTNRGLSRADISSPEHLRFRKYTPEDGLQSYEFNTNVYFKTGDGEMLFGGVNGFNTFHPDSVADNPAVPPVVITGFKKFDVPVPLESNVAPSGEMRMNYRESVFSFEFSALEFTNPRRNQYAYMMQGFDRDWISCGVHREARYTNLDPGEYTFRVKGSNSDGVWNEQGASVKIIILPPYWRTWWAYTLYSLLLVSGGVGTRWLVQNWKIIIANRKAKFVSHYKVLEKLGQGGMGTVYKATDLHDKRVVALKVLSSELLKDPENRKRLASEGQLLSSFTHPNIVRVFEVGESSERGFIAMEYLTGGTLAQLRELSFPLPFKDCKRIALQTCSALEEIHEAGVIHRDIKRGNIMLDGNGDVRIMDFGLSKSPLVTTMTTLGSVVGTLGYVAPEQVTGISVDHRTDIFSFGIVLYELLTNQLPFRGENEIAVIHSIFNTSPAPPSELIPGIPPALDGIVIKCLQKEPACRYPSAGELRIALEGEFW